MSNEENEENEENKENEEKVTAETQAEPQLSLIHI